MWSFGTSDSERELRMNFHCSGPVQMLWCMAIGKAMSMPLLPTDFSTGILDFRLELDIVTTETMIMSVMDKLFNRQEKDCIIHVCIFLLLK